MSVLWLEALSTECPNAPFHLAVNFQHFSSNAVIFMSSIVPNLIPSFSRVAASAGLIIREKISQLIFQKTLCVQPPAGFTHQTFYTCPVPLSLKLDVSQGNASCCTSRNSCSLWPQVLHFAQHFVHSEIMSILEKRWYDLPNLPVFNFLSMQWWK